jgi:hypothetical protein
MGWYEDWMAAANGAENKGKRKQDEINYWTSVGVQNQNAANQQQYWAKYQQDQVEAEKKRQADEQYKSWVETNPQTYYSSQLSGLDDTIRDFYSGKYNDIYSEYLNSQALAVKGGGTKITQGYNTWSDYLKNYNWKQKYQDATPYNNRGGYAQSSLAPRTRILNY